MIPDREYVFASSFIKASDGRGTPAERLAKFREASDTEALRAAVSEAFGVSAENAYDGAVTAAVNLALEAIPDKELVSPLLYKYDCANIKTAIKCAIRNISPEGLLYTCGTVPPETVIGAAAASDFKKLPGEMGKAAGEALETYRKTGEVRAIDLIIDRACFEDMKNSAEKSGCTLVKDIVKLRADGVNLLTAIRISAEGHDSDTAFSLFERAFVPGGNMSVSAFASQEAGVFSADKIAARACGAMSAAIKSAAKESDPENAQRIIDEEIIKLCRKFRFKPFGPEVAVSLIVVREAEITNCRIIEASFGEDKADETVRERLRVAYV